MTDFCAEKLVFQIGMHKTATCAIFDALCKLGIKSMHVQPERLQKMWNCIGRATAYEDYKGFTDFLWIHSAEEFEKACSRVRFLRQTYPNAKFILNVRDCDDWLQSHVSNTYAHNVRVYSTNDLCAIKQRWFAWHAFVFYEFAQDRERLLYFDTDKHDFNRVVDFLGIAIDKPIESYWGRVNVTQKKNVWPLPDSSWFVGQKRADEIESKPQTQSPIMPLEAPFYEWAALNKAYYSTVDKREIGISFMIRAKNEENCIAESICSLQENLDGKIKYNIVFVDNGSTDDTFAIAKRHLNADNDVAVQYPLQVAKAGLETYVTPCNSAHSLPWFYQFCLQQCTAYSHVFKWDADFRLTAELASRLVAEFGPSRAEKPALRYEVAAVHEDEKLGWECYLIAVETHYRYFRSFLWECWWAPRNCWPLKRLDKRETILHASKLEKPKSYLKLAPWWENESEEIKKQAHTIKAKQDYNDWVEKLPDDIQLFCRARDPACIAIQRALPKNKSSIEGL